MDSQGVGHDWVAEHTHTHILPAAESTRVCSAGCVGAAPSSPKQVYVKGWLAAVTSHPKLYPNPFFSLAIIL